MPALFSKLCEGGGVITNGVEAGDRDCGELQEVMLRAATAIHRVTLQSAGCATREIVVFAFMVYYLSEVFQMLAPEEIKDKEEGERSQN